MLKALNSMMLDMVAAISRKDYEDRRRRQGEGIARAKNAGKYRGTKPDAARRETISALLRDNKSYGEIVALLGCSRVMIASVKKGMIAQSCVCFVLLV